MRKGSLTFFWIAAGLLASVFFLFLTNESTAKMGLQMPNLKKQDFKSTSQVQLQADQVSFSSADNKAHAQGNVVVTTKDQQLYCDQLQLDRVVKEVVAEGDVYLDTPQENIIAQGLTYNFNDGTGQFRDARMYIDPYQMKGKTIDKISENYMVMKKGYITTCDLDEPHFRVAARRMDIYQHDRAIAHSMKIYLGKVPVMYLPYYVQDLKNKPIFTFIPGHSKNFGYFLLTTTSLKLSPHAHLNVYEDIRDRTGFSEGFDLKYKTSNFGSGLLRTYYAAEAKVYAKHIWKKYNKFGNKRGPTTHHERYRIIWRHKWQIDPNTSAIWQIYKIHDWDIINNGFLKQYFPREFRQGTQGAATDSYFLFTHNMPHGTLTFHIEDTRINRPLRGVEYYPQIQYVVNSQQIGKTGFYVKSTNEFSNITHQDYPKTHTDKTMRFDTYNDISHPFKIAFIQINPHVGEEETYYTRTADLSENNIFRGQFHTGADLTTSFYKTWSFQTNFAGLNINGLRHIITPTAFYVYQHVPTFPTANLNQFDGIDSRDQAHYITLGLENKLQTHRNGRIVDLIRALVSSTFALKENPGRGGFGPVDATIDMYPTNWLRLHADSEYDHYARHYNTADFDGTINYKNWSVSLGDRWSYGSGAELTTQIQHRINSKWSVSAYERIGVGAGGGATPVKNSGNKEEEFVVTRDLHEWEMNFSYRTQRGVGSEFFLIFRLKAMPNMKLDLFNTSFHQRRAGSQSTDPQNAANTPSTGTTGATQ